MQLCVSYADPNQGHHGGIYQAGNWIYAGETPKSIKYIAKDGKVLHPRQVSPKGIKIQYGEYRKVPKPQDCKKIQQEGKHRYLMPLTPEMRKKILPLSKPYPKRV